MSSRHDPELEAALQKFGDILMRPTTIAEQAARKDRASYEPPEGKPPNLRNISPNQFALPGMEEHAHPGARHVAKGVMFHMVGQDRDPQLWAHDTVHKRTVGTLDWAGEHVPRGAAVRYPGEIKMIERNRRGPANQEGGFDPLTPEMHHPGVMSDMFKLAHHVNMGQATVPVHSPTRTEHGEAWSAKIGPEELRPQRYDNDWRPPTGIHPYERHGNPRQFQATAGQHRLFDPEKENIPPKHASEGWGDRPVFSL